MLSSAWWDAWHQTVGNDSTPKEVCIKLDGESIRPVHAVLESLESTGRALRNTASWFVEEKGTGEARPSIFGMGFGVHFVRWQWRHPRASPCMNGFVILDNLRIDLEVSLVVFLGRAPNLMCVKNVFWESKQFEANIFNRFFLISQSNRPSPCLLQSES